MFQDLGVHVVAGHWFLGGYIGDLCGRDDFVQKRVDKWASDVRTFSGIASTQPQLAYSAVTRSLQHEWSFLLRVVPGCGALFQELELVLGSAFLPALFGVEISAVEPDLFSLPLRMGGLTVVNPVTALLPSFMIHHLVPLPHLLSL